MKLFGPCAKRRVQAKLTTLDGEVFVAENVCLTPQPKCPRRIGEGYEKCTTVCHQVGHAEALVIQAAGGKAAGAHIDVTHHYACDACLQKMRAAGVIAIEYRSPVDSVRTR